MCLSCLRMPHHVLRNYESKSGGPERDLKYSHVRLPGLPLPEINSWQPQVKISELLSV